MTGPIWQADPRYRPYIVGALALIALFHVLVPLRHHFYPGDVAWTEEGHRYSWRMMLRSKSGNGKFVVETPELVADSVVWKAQTIYPRKELNKKQNRKLYTHPDMILQYAHHLRDRYLAEGHDSVRVYAKVRTRLNFRNYHAYVDPEVDLAREEWNLFGPNRWILREGE